TFAMVDGRLWAQEPLTLRVVRQPPGCPTLRRPERGEATALFERSLKHQDEVEEPRVEVQVRGFFVVSRCRSSRSAAARMKSVRSSPCQSTAAMRLNVPSAKRACMSSAHCRGRPICPFTIAYPIWVSHTTKFCPTLSSD